MPTPFSIYEVQIQNLNTGDSLITAGGTVHVAQAGLPDLQDIYDADTLLAATNPLTPVRGKIRFATLATVASVDLYGIDADGRFFVRKGVKPGAVTEIYPDDGTHQVAVIPFSVADATAATEKDTGFDLPLHAVVESAGVHVTAADATETIDVGVLSSETAGDADGFLVAASVAATGRVLGLLIGTDTRGALLREDTNAASVFVPKGHPFTGSDGRSISYTLSAGSDTAKGFIHLPYVRCLS